MGGRVWRAGDAGLPSSRSSCPGGTPTTARSARADPLALALKRVKVLVSGQVQGVFFRAECASRARDLGLGGFVRNLRDGRVEAVFEGDPAGVDALVDWCRTGPRWAQVENVEVVEEEPKGESQFLVTR